jgi:hypothetical protein
MAMQAPKPSATVPSVIKPAPSSIVPSSSSTSATDKLPSSISLAKVLGPRTAARISASSSTAPARGTSSVSIADLLQATVIPKAAPASLPPKGKVKARMRMREKPLTAFSFGAPRPAAMGHVTRSVSLKKKAGGRSGSVGARNDKEAGMMREYLSSSASTILKAGLQNHLALLNRRLTTLLAPPHLVQGRPHQSLLLLPLTALSILRDQSWFRSPHSRSHLPHQRQAHSPSRRPRETPQRVMRILPQR